MPKKEHIVLIGAGNVATHMGMALKKAGHKIAQVYSPGGQSARGLAKKLTTESISDIRKLKKDASLYIIAVNDDAITEVAEQLELKNKVVVHTSGSVKMNALKAASENYGVLYPLQTFSKNKTIQFKAVPLCIEASNEATASSLLSLANSISQNVREVNSEQRRAIHLAAVFACNFSNHLYHIAEVILSSEQMSFDLLKPLILETAQKVQTSHPAKVQTGPAVRGDQKTIKTHLKLLKGDKKLRTLYKLMTESISETDKKIVI
jgi:predicted short-subunit dehydrogenase-like oxidoreductase (DUF2520 family)